MKKDKLYTVSKYSADRINEKANLFPYGGLRLIPNLVPSMPYTIPIGNSRIDYDNLLNGIQSYSTNNTNNVDLNNSRVAYADALLSGSVIPNMAAVPSLGADKQSSFNILLGRDWLNQPVPTGYNPKTAFENLSGTISQGISAFQKNNPLGGKAHTTPKWQKAAGMIGGVVGGVGSKLISGGYSTGGVGEGITGVGGAVGSAISTVNPLVGGIVSAGSGILGGLVNRGFGVKRNNKNIASIKANTGDIRTSGNQLASATTNEAFMDAAANMGTGSGFKSGDLVKGGWFSGGKAAREANRYLNAEKQALAMQTHAMAQGAKNVDKIQDDNVMANFAAMGGSLNDTEQYADGGYMGALDYDLATRYLTMKEMQNQIKDRIPSNPFGALAVSPFNGYADGGILFRKGGPLIKEENKGKFTAQAKAAGMGTQQFASHVLANKEDYSPTTVKRANFAHVFGGRNYDYGGPLFNDDNLFDIGGVLQSHGSDWSNGSSHIDEGGTHEENPNQGVQVGVDPEGTPNLVEEGEVIYNDYVYSQRIELDDEAKEKFHFSKKRDITYADAAKKLEKEISERPNDPLSKAAFKSQMQDLAEEQERQKAEMQAEEAREQFESLSPEEQVAVMQNAEAQEQQAAEEEAMMQEQAAQEQAMQEQAAMQGQPTEEQMMQEQMMAQQQGMVPQQPVGMEAQMGGYAEGGLMGNEYAMGGNLFVTGGPEKRRGAGGTWTVDRKNGKGSFGGGSFSGAGAGSDFGSTLEDAMARKQKSFKYHGQIYYIDYNSGNVTTGSGRNQRVVYRGVTQNSQPLVSSETMDTVAVNSTPEIVQEAPTVIQENSTNLTQESINNGDDSLLQEYNNTGKANNRFKARVASTAAEWLKRHYPKLTNQDIQRLQTVVANQFVKQAEDKKLRINNFDNLNFDSQIANLFSEKSPSNITNYGLDNNTIRRMQSAMGYNVIFGEDIVSAANNWAKKVFPGNNKVQKAFTSWMIRGGNNYVDSKGNYDFKTAYEQFSNAVNNNNNYSRAIDIKPSDLPKLILYRNNKTGEVFYTKAEADASADKYNREHNLGKHSTNKNIKQVPNNGLGFINWLSGQRTMLNNYINSSEGRTIRNKADAAWKYLQSVLTPEEYAIASKDNGVKNFVNSYANSDKDLNYLKDTVSSYRNQASGEISESDLYSPQDTYMQGYPPTAGNTGTYNPTNYGTASGGYYQAPPVAQPTMPSMPPVYTDENGQRMVLTNQGMIPEDRYMAYWQALQERTAAGPDATTAQPVTVTPYDENTLGNALSRAIGVNTKDDLVEWLKNNNVKGADKWDNTTDFNEDMWLQIRNDPNFLNALAEKDSTLADVLRKGYDYGKYRPEETGVIQDINKGNWKTSGSSRSGGIDSLIKGWTDSEDAMWQEVKDKINNKMSLQEIQDLMMSTNAWKKTTDYLKRSPNNMLAYLQAIQDNPDSPIEARNHYKNFVDIDDKGKLSWKKGFNPTYDEIFGKVRTTYPGTYWHSYSPALRDRETINMIKNSKGEWVQALNNVKGDDWKEINRYSWDSADPDKGYEYIYWNTPEQIAAEAQAKVGTAKKEEQKKGDKGNIPIVDYKHKYFGLGDLGPIIGLGLQAAGFGKPDSSVANAAIDVLARRGAAVASHMPIGNRIKYKPMDIWAQQNRNDANSNAVNRALLNNASPVGTRNTGLIANSYAHQIGAGELYKNALQYNDSLAQQVAAFNRDTDKFNAEAFNRMSLTNAELLNRYRQQLATMRMQQALNDQESRASWYRGIYKNIDNFATGLGAHQRQNDQGDMIAGLINTGVLGNIGEDTPLIEGTGFRIRRRDMNRDMAAEGGKINRKKRKGGLTF